LLLVFIVLSVPFFPFSSFLIEFFFRERVIGTPHNPLTSEGHVLVVYNGIQSYRPSSLAAKSVTGGCPAEA
jgi:hypothetical protein